MQEVYFLEDRIGHKPIPVFFIVEIDIVVQSLISRAFGYLLKAINIMLYIIQ